MAMRSQHMSTNSVATGLSSYISDIMNRQQRDRSKDSALAMRQKELEAQNTREANRLAENKRQFAIVHGEDALTEAENLAKSKLEIDILEANKNKPVDFYTTKQIDDKTSVDHTELDTDNFDLAKQKAKELRGKRDAEGNLLSYMPVGEAPKPFDAIKTVVTPEQEELLKKYNAIMTDTKLSNPEKELKLRMELLSEKDRDNEDGFFTTASKTTGDFIYGDVVNSVANAKDWVADKLKAVLTNQTATEELQQDIKRQKDSETYQKSMGKKFKINNPIDTLKDKIKTITDLKSTNDKKREDYTKQWETYNKKVEAKDKYLKNLEKAYQKNIYTKKDAKVLIEDRDLIEKQAEDKLNKTLAIIDSSNLSELQRNKRKVKAYENRNKVLNKYDEAIQKKVKQIEKVKETQNKNIEKRAFETFKSKLAIKEKYNKELAILKAKKTQKMTESEKKAHNLKQRKLEAEVKKAEIDAKIAKQKYEDNK